MRPLFLSIIVSLLVATLPDQVIAERPIPSPPPQAPFIEKKANDPAFSKLRFMLED